MWYGDDGMCVAALTCVLIRLHAHTLLFSVVITFNVIWHEANRP